MNFTSVGDLRALFVLKPLIDSGQVTFLPQYGESLRRWNYPNLNLPSLPDPYLEEKICDLCKKPIVDSGLFSLYIDNIVSDKLGCIHLLPSSCIDKVGINGIPSSNSTLNKTASYAFLKLKLPYVTNLTYG